MPAVSEKQRKLFGMALSYKRGKLKDASEEIKNLANSMSEKKLSDFASKIKKENKMKMTELIKIIREVIKDEESLEEITTTGTEQGSEEYNTPQAFSSNKKDKEKRNKKMANMIN
ncbi:MAG: DUF3008 family protein [Actinobacteria bacterium]|nr:DUF3008 family protein [Actinomycetota bacterium]